MITLNKIKEKDIHLYAILIKIDNDYYEISKEIDKSLYDDSRLTTEIILHIFVKDKSLSFYSLKNISVDCNLPFRIYEFEQVEEDNIPDKYQSYFIRLEEE